MTLHHLAETSGTTTPTVADLRAVIAGLDQRAVPDTARVELYVYSDSGDPDRPDLRWSVSVEWQDDETQEVVDHD